MDKVKGRAQNQKCIQILKKMERTFDELSAIKGTTSKAVIIKDGTKIFYR